MSKIKQSLQSSSCVYHDKAPAFAFTNENIAAYLRQIGELTDKDVLTVAASGDHAFEAYMAGARTVDTFDINENQRLVAELKAKMIRGLSYENFMDFFFSHFDNFSPRILAPIYQKLSPQLQLFLLYNYAGENMLHDYAMESVEWISYLDSESEYNKLKTKPIHRIHFKHTDIKSVPGKFHQKYDLIMLSNICESMYPRERVPHAAYRLFYNDVLRPIGESRLRTGGKVCFDYIFGMPTISEEDFYSYWANQTQQFQRELGEQSPYKFDVLRIPSSAMRGYIDLVMTMEKVR